MRFKSFLFIFCGISLISGVSQAAPVRKIVPKGAVSFTSKVGGFAVWLPVEPVALQEKPGSVRNRLPAIMQFVTKTQPVGYSVSALPIHPSDANASPINHLDGMQNGWVHVSHGILQKREEIQLSSFVGREIQIRSQRGSQRGTTNHTSRMRFYFTPEIRYQILAFGPEAEMQKQAAQINRVFDSFRILPQ